MSKSSARKKLQNALAKLKYVLPYNNKGLLSPDLTAVIPVFIHGNIISEYFGFLTGNPAMFKTYGMTEEERNKSSITFDNTKNCLVDNNGDIVDVYDKIYVITKDGRLIIQPKNITGNFYHSSITRDEAVVCAGNITIKEGKITKINNNSGHYRPTELDLFNAITFFKKNFNNTVFAEDFEVYIYAVRDAYNIKKTFRI